MIVRLTEQAERWAVLLKEKSELPGDRLSPSDKSKLIKLESSIRTQLSEYGITSKVVVAFLIAFFPIVIDMAAGLTMVEKELIDLMRSLGAKRGKIFIKAQIPHSLPFLFSGMRIAVTLAIIGAIVGEFIGGSQGIGYLIVISTSELKTELVFACLLVLTAAGFLLFAFIGLLERIIVPWSAAEREELMLITGS